MVEKAFNEYIEKLRSGGLNPNEGQIFVLKHAFYVGVSAMLFILGGSESYEAMILNVDCAVKECAKYEMEKRPRNGHPNNN